MRSLGGFILLAGIGVALFVYLPAPVDSGASLHRLQRVATSRSSQLPPANITSASGLGSFSPSVTLSMPAARRCHASSGEYFILAEENRITRRACRIVALPRQRPCP